MANEKPMWQSLLRMAEDKGQEFSRMAAGIYAQLRDGRARFDVSRMVSELRASLPTTNDLNTAKGQVSTQSQLRKTLVGIVTPVVAAAPRSNVTKDIVAMSVQAGQELNKAVSLIAQAEEKQKTVIGLLAQIEAVSEQAAQLMFMAEKAVASANTVTVQIEVRLRRAISDIDGV